MAALRITSPAEHRALLLSAMECVCEGRINVAQANALVGLSGEVHKSLKQEWDMRIYAAENLFLKRGQVVKMLEVEVKDGDDNVTD